MNVYPMSSLDSLTQLPPWFEPPPPLPQSPLEPSLPLARLGALDNNVHTNSVHNLIAWDQGGKLCKDVCIRRALSGCLVSPSCGWSHTSFQHTTSCPLREWPEVGRGWQGSPVCSPSLSPPPSHTSTLPGTGLSLTVTRCTFQGRRQILTSLVLIPPEVMKGAAGRREGVAKKRA